VAALPGGGFLYADYGHNLVREVSPAGIVTTVAGNGTTTDAANGTLAVNSGLNGPISVAPLQGGGFLITEYYSSVVRLVTAGTPQTATIITIAGTGTAGNDCQTTGPATSIKLNFPADAEPTADGHILIADNLNNYIRELDSASAGATMTTIAGSTAGCSGLTTCTGMPANGVQLANPVYISPINGGSGGYLISEYGNNAVRKVSAVGPSERSRRSRATEVRPSAATTALPRRHR
jgi:hypothetical protein